MECQTCEEWLLSEAFDLNRSKKQCLSCGRYVEAWQRALRDVWKTNYRTKWNALRKDTEAWKAALRAFRAANPELRKGIKRTLPADTEQVIAEHTRTKKHTLHRHREPKTWPAYLEWAQKAKNGGYTPEGALREWNKMMRDGVKSDKLGVVNGMTGQLRLWIRTGEVESSADESAEVRGHRRATRPRREMPRHIVQEFLHGNVGFEEPEPVNAATVEAAALSVAGTGASDAAEEGGQGGSLEAAGKKSEVWDGALRALAAQEWWKGMRASLFEAADKASAEVQAGEKALQEESVARDLRAYADLLIARKGVLEALREKGSEGLRQLQARCQKAGTEPVAGFQSLKRTPPPCCARAARVFEHA